MSGTAAEPPAASTSESNDQRQYAALSSGDMRAANGERDSDLGAASAVASVAKRVDAHELPIEARSRHRQAMASAVSTGVVSFEQRLKDAASKKRLAREQRCQSHHTPLRQQLQSQLQPQQQRQVSADSLPGELASASSALASRENKLTTTIKGTTTSDSSSLAPTPTPPASRSITETIKCWSHPLFARWLLARTTSCPDGGGSWQEVDKNRQQVERNDIDSSNYHHQGWTSTTRQTTSQAVVESTGQARRPVVVDMDSSLSTSSRSKKNQTASFRLNKLLAQSLADTAMLPVQSRPGSLRGRQHTTARTTRSVYAKPEAYGTHPLRGVRGARRSTIDISATAATVARATVAGHYAQNIIRQDQAGVFEGQNVKPPAKIVKTLEEAEDEKAELEDEANVDGGYAWIILAVVFIINASTWGTARAYGQIFDKLARETGIARTRAAMPFTIMGAVENMAGPLSGCLLALTRSWRVTVVAGSTMITLAHLCAGLSADCELGQLLSMGLMCGLGLSFVSISFFQVNNAYFVRYRNTAFGVGLAGAVFGTLIISPLCQYFLDNYPGTRACYLMLSLIISPNIALALLLKPKRQLETGSGTTRNNSMASLTSSSSLSTTDDDEQVKTISERVEEQKRRRRSSQRSDPADVGIWTSIRLVVANPMFHLIWPTQLIFCWFNFVFGLIIVDFGNDRGLNSQDVAHLVPSWAFGQLVGRLFLSSLVDLKFLSYKSFTIICFLAIGVTMYLLNNARLDGVDELRLGDMAGNSEAYQHYLTILVLVFVLSMFIALLYILLNGLVFNYVETGLQPLSLGISSFTGSFFLLPRANIIGYYRDTTGNYDDMLTMFTYVSMCAALVWLILPPVCKYLKDLTNRIKQSRDMARKSIQSTRPYSAWLLDQQQLQGPRPSTNDHQV